MRQPTTARAGPRRPLTRQAAPPPVIHPSKSIRAHALKAPSTDEECPLGSTRDANTHSKEEPTTYSRTRPPEPQYTTCSDRSTNAFHSPASAPQYAVRRSHATLVATPR
eukprot:4508417-Prymnesium_polylepis.1